MRKACANPTEGFWENITGHTWQHLDLTLAPLEWGELLGAIMGRISEGIKAFITGCFQSFISIVGTLVQSRVRSFTSRVILGQPDVLSPRSNYPPAFFPIWLQLVLSFLFTLVACILGRRQAQQVRDVRVESQIDYGAAF